MVRKLIAAVHPLTLFHRKNRHHQVDQITPAEVWASRSFVSNNVHSYYGPWSRCYVQRSQLIRSRFRIGERENLQLLAIKNLLWGRCIGPPSVHAHQTEPCAPGVSFLGGQPSLLYQIIESSQCVVADVLEWFPMCPSVLRHRLAKAVGASCGEGRRSVGGAVPAALCEPFMALGGGAGHVVALEAPMPARGMVGLLQIAHRALVLRLVSAAGVNVKLGSQEARAKNPMRVFLDPAYRY